MTGGEPPPPRGVSDGESVLLDSDVAGDEPYMLARNLPGVIVLVDGRLLTLNVNQESRIWEE